MIQGKDPLRQPPITIVHFPVEGIKELYTTLRDKLTGFQMKYSGWKFYSLNIEKEIFMILRKLEYTHGDKYALTESRSDLKSDLSNSIKQDLLRKIGELVSKASKENGKNRYPPFVFLLHIHSFYDYIQSKDIITEIINQNNVQIIIPYLETSLTKSNQKGDEIYKLANYNVHSVHINANS